MHSIETTVALPMDAADAAEAAKALTAALVALDGAVSEPVA